MPGSTGPDLNTYSIPEVQLGDTFNYWKDVTNTAIYKLNKLKIYDAVGSGSLGVTYGSTGTWVAFIQPTITDGITFTQTIRFTSGISSGGVFSSRGITLNAGDLWIVGGITASGGLTLGGGIVTRAGVSMASGLTVGGNAVIIGNLQVDTTSDATFFVDSTNNRVGIGTISPNNARLDVRGGITADYLFASTGSTFAGTLQVNGGATFASTTDHTGAARFSGGLSASAIYASTGSTFAGTLVVSSGLTVGGRLDVGGVLDVVSGATLESTLDVTGFARFNGGLSAARIYASGSTFASNLDVLGGLTATRIYASTGSTFAGTLQVNGGATFASTTDYTGAARFSGGLSASAIYASGSTFASNLDVLGGLTATRIYASTGSTFAGTLQVNGGATFASTVDVTGLARFNGGLSASAIYASTGSTFGSTLQVNGGATFASTTDHTGAARFSGGLSASAIYASTGSTFASSVVFVSGLSAGLGTTLNNLFVGGSAAIGSLSVRNGGVFAESGVALHVDGPTRIDPFNPLPNTGAIVPDSNLRMYRDVLSPSIYGGTSLVAGLTTGCLVFVMPKAWSDTMLRMSIKGYNYDNSGAWEMVVGGYNYAASSVWVNTSQEIRGVAPTTTVRLAHHDTLNRGCLILGPGNWSYAKVYLDSVFATHNNPDGWGAGWTAYYESGNLAGISAGSIRTCSSNGIVGLGNGNYGLGTTFAQFGFDVVGTGRYSSGLTVGGRLDVVGVLDVGGGATLESTLDVGGAARISGNLAVDNTTLFVNSSTDRVGIGVSSPGSTLDIWGTVRIVNAGTSGGGSSPTSHPLFISNNPGNIGAFLGDGNSTLEFGGNTFSSAIRFNGANVAWGDIAYYPQGFTNGFTSGAGHFRFSRAGTSVVPTANAMVSVGDLFSEGQVWAGATGTFAGNAILRGQKSLLFADADSSNWVAFRAPATVTSNVTWTLPNVDGSNGQVLSTDASGNLSWKPADGVTGSDKQIQFNRGGTLGATASLVFEYSASAGFSAGTLGVSGGMYSLGNVGIGITPGAISGRIYSNSTAKLEVRGDIRIPSNGFFVNKGMTLPSAVETVITADENAFIAGTLAVPSGATLTINSGGRLIVM